MTRQENTKKLIEASRNGHIEIVKLLIPVSDPKVNDSEALFWACEHGHTDIVKVLLPVSDPKSNHYETLRWSCHENHRDIFEVLCSVFEISDLKEALDWMENSNKKSHQEKWDTFLLEEYLKIQQEKETLYKNIVVKKTISLSKKI